MASTRRMTEQLGGADRAPVGARARQFVEDLKAGLQVNTLNHNGFGDKAPALVKNPGLGFQARAEKNAIEQRVANLNKKQQPGNRHLPKCGM